MTDGKNDDVRELRLEGIGLLLIVGFLGATLIGAFFLGRWYERSSAPPVGLGQLASDPLGHVVPPDEVEDVDASANRFDTLEGRTEAEPERQVTPPPPQEAPPRQAPPPRTEPAASNPVPSSGGPFYVQIGAFRDRSSADKIVSELRAAGYPVRVFTGDGSSGPLFKVRVGGYSTRDEATTTVAELQTKGHPGAFTIKAD